jgi:CspA family cold shock protein
MKTGTVKWFNAEMGYGFILPDDGGPELFVHIRAVEHAGMDALKEGQRVSFEVFTDESAARSSAAVTLSDA